MKVFVNRHKEVRSGWAIALALGAFFVLQVAYGLVLSALLRLLPYTPAVVRRAASLLYTTFALQMASSLTMAAVATVCFMLLYKKPLAQLGLALRGAPGRFLAGCAFGAAAIAAVFALLVLAGWVRVQQVQPGQLASANFWLWLWVFALVALGEEMLYRGFIMQALKTTRSRGAVYGVSALLFSLMHAANPGFGPLALFNIALVGLLFALLAEITGSLWAPIGFHFMWNFLQGNVFGLGVSGVQTGAVVTVWQSGPRVFTGGGFGPEGGLVATGVLLICLVALLFLGQKRVQSGLGQQAAHL